MSRPGRDSAAARVERVYGLAAALAAFERRPDAVVNIAHTKDARKALAPLLRDAARRRIAYREVDPETLARLAESTHHEGVCLLVRARDNGSPEGAIEALGPRGLIVALDRVSNPHNIGAILRSAAYFGARALVFESDAGKGLTPAARRVAEGGAEHVLVTVVPSLVSALDVFARAGLPIVGSDARAQQPLGAYRWPPRAVLTLGHEQRGLRPEVRARCDVLLRIGGTSAVDSLNVSVAAGIFLASFGADGART